MTKGQYKKAKWLKADIKYTRRKIEGLQLDIKMGPNKRPYLGDSPGRRAEMQERLVADLEEQQARLSLLQAEFAAL